MALINPGFISLSYDFPSFSLGFLMFFPCLPHGTSGFDGFPATSLAVTGLHPPRGRLGAGPAGTQRGGHTEERDPC